MARSVPFTAQPAKLTTLWRSGLVGFVALALTACGGEGGELPQASGGTGSTSDTAFCADDPADVSPLGNFVLDDVVVLTADLVGVTVSVSGSDLVVRWDLAPGASATRAIGGNHGYSVNFERADGGSPLVELSASFSGSDVYAHLTTNTEEAGLVSTADPEGAVIEVDGDSVVLSVPIASLADIGAEEWRWSATTTAARANPVSGEQAMGQDACGSDDAGAGSLIVFFPGPDLPAIDVEDFVAPAAACEGVPSKSDMEAILEVPLDEPFELLGLCSYSGSSDPTVFVEFRRGPASTCGQDTEFETTGELDGYSYGIQAGGVMELCTPEESLALNMVTSLGDSGAIALEIMQLWLDEREGS